MKLYLILEDIDLGYHCQGIFDNEDQAKLQMERLLEAQASLKFFNKERPEDWKTYSKLYIEEFILNDSSVIEDGINWRTNLIENVYKPELQK